MRANHNNLVFVVEKLFHTVSTAFKGTFGDEIKTFPFVRKLILLVKERMNEDEENRARKKATRTLTIKNIRITTTKGKQKIEMLRN